VSWSGLLLCSHGENVATIQRNEIGAKFFFFRDSVGVVFLSFASPDTVSPGSVKLASLARIRAERCPQQVENGETCGKPGAVLGINV
jgi:hypothetical protein